MLYLSWGSRWLGSSLGLYRPTLSCGSIAPLRAACLNRHAMRSWPGVRWWRSYTLQTEFNIWWFQSWSVFLGLRIIATYLFSIILSYRNCTVLFTLKIQLRFYSCYLNLELIFTARQLAHSNFEIFKTEVLSHDWLTSFSISSLM